MRVLIVLDNFYIPQYSGGVESSTHELAMELISRGHSVCVLCKLAPGGFLRLRAARRLSGKPYGHDSRLGYPVYRAWNVPDAIAFAVEDLAPDVVLIQNWSPVRIARALLNRNVPTAIYLHNVETKLLDGDLAAMTGARFIANSEFTAGRYRAQFGIEPIVIPPLFVPAHYRGRHDPSNVTLINPHPKKGGYLAFDIAERLPEIPFHFFQSWTLGEEHYAFMCERMKTVKNVTFHARTHVMKTVYSRAKIILAPSQWEEAWGRVASEAHFNGIPVVASDIGGLPESVGPGGILLAPGSPVESWVEAVRRLWTDERFYAEKSSAALAYSKRPQLDSARQVDTLLSVLHAAMRGSEHQPLAAG